MEKKNSSSKVGIILMGMKSGSLTPMEGNILLWMALWLSTIYDLYLCLLQPMLHFLFSTWNFGNGSKEAKPQVPTLKRCSSKNVKNEKLVRGDLGMVMEKLGISGDLDGDKLLDRLGTADIENLFVETEPSLEEVKEAFDVFDENNDGYIDAEELEKILCKLGIVEVPKGECQRMITVFDDNGDGRIEFREFIKLVENMFG